MPSRRLKSEAFSSLPTPWPDDPVQDLRRLVEKDRSKIVVLDDDPTGTQTVHDLAVVTDWSVDTLQREFQDPSRCFFVLTNSRALNSAAAESLALEIGRNLQAAARSTGRPFVVISRGDSTLRGHFPIETDALAKGLEASFHATVLIPFFEAGGRFTINDVHYVTQGEELVPVGQTQFAADASFGYRSSHLTDWVIEKTGGAHPPDKILSVSISDLRQKGPDQVTRLLDSVSPGSIVIVNAASQRDLEIFALGAIQSEMKGLRFLYRTAASFVAVRAAIPPRDLLTSRELLSSSGTVPGVKTGGLVIVGSHVNTTTEQLAVLRQHGQIEFHHLDIEKILNYAQREEEIAKSARKIDETLAKGDHLIVSTTRKLVSGDSPAASLEIANQISSALVEIMRRLTVRPRWIVAKGGITSSDIAVKGLGVKRAWIMGQALPGVPVWKLAEESAFPGLTYVVFPGNVGTPDSLLQVFTQLDATIA